MRRTSLTDVLSFVSGTTTFSMEHSSCGTYPIPAIPHEPRPPKPTENPPKNATSISGRFHFTSQRCSSVSFHFTICIASRDSRLCKDIRRATQKKQTSQLRRLCDSGSTFTRKDRRSPASSAPTIANRLPMQACKDVTATFRL